MKSFWGDYRPPPAGQSEIHFPPPAGTDPEALCGCGHFSRQHGEAGACGRCGCTVWLEQGEREELERIVREAAGK